MHATRTYSSCVSDTLATAGVWRRGSDVLGKAEACMNDDSMLGCLTGMSLANIAVS